VGIRTVCAAPKQYTYRCKAPAIRRMRIDVVWNLYGSVKSRVILARRQDECPWRQLGLSAKHLPQNGTGRLMTSNFLESSAKEGGEKSSP
jgi:hypothetical protein